MSIPADQFRLDPRLLSPKLEDISRDMNERAVAGTARIRSEVEKSGNTAGYLPRFFDFHAKLVDEWASKVFDAYCEAWQEQNGSVTPAFIRWVWGIAIIPLIATRKSTVISQVNSRGTKNKQPPDGIALRGWSRRIDQLKANKNSELEAKAAKLEYHSVRRPQQQDRTALQGLPSEPAQGTADKASPDADAWRAFRAAFEALMQEESSGVIRHGQERWVIAYSQRDMTEWHISEGGESLRARLEVLAARAGAKLGPAQGSTKLNYWLHRLYLELKSRHSKLLFEADGGTPQVCITRVCEGSAIFCARLEQEAVENSSETRTGTNSKAAGTRTTAYRSAVKRFIAFHLSQNPDATDHAICRALDADGGLDLPKGWKNKPQDRRFVDAYLDDGRRNKVEVTISKVRRDLRKLRVLPAR
jgi:hypothetical protein